jgi:hypothetical protein
MLVTEERAQLPYLARMGSDVAANRLAAPVTVELCSIDAYSKKGRFRGYVEHEEIWRAVKQLTHL